MAWVESRRATGLVAVLGLAFVLVFLAAAPARAIFGSDVCPVDPTTIASLIGPPGQPYMYPTQLRDSGHPKALKLCQDECKASKKACTQQVKSVVKCQLGQETIEAKTDAKNFCPALNVGDKTGEKACKKYYAQMLKDLKAMTKVQTNTATLACEQYQDACLVVCGM
mgnify:CR=1 FL=1